MADPLLFTPPCGPVTGWFDTDADVHRATGIPYARASRFKAPQPAPGHTQTLEATHWSPACPQRSVPFLDTVLGKQAAGRPADENCQHLSITMPKNRETEERLPVMVWIHGGSYVSGAGDLAIMDPAALVSSQRVIVVTITYRLGLFGYLGDGKNRPANLGLLDQLEAFRWVQRNIAAFGGDSSQVTAFGQSAGGDAVAHLMATPDAPALFSKAIIQSAPFGVMRKRTKMTRAMNQAAAGLCASSSVQQILNRQPAVEKAGQGFGLASFMPFGVQYGQYPLPVENTIENAWKVAAAEIDVLVGHTAEEVALFIPQIGALERLRGVPVLKKLTAKALTKVFTYLIYGRGGRRFARNHARSGGTAHHYVLSWAPDGNSWGAAHTADLPLLFGDEAAWRDADLIRGTEWTTIEEAATKTRAIWGAFARGENFSARVANHPEFRCREMPRN